MSYLLCTDGVGLSTTELIGSSRSLLGTSVLLAVPFSSFKSKVCAVQRLGLALPQVGRSISDELSMATVPYELKPSEFCGGLPRLQALSGILAE